jgi:sortase A
LKLQRYARYWPLAAVIITAAFLLLDALWIPVKAELAQRLLEHAWQKTRDGDSAAQPWPWADTRPVGVLEVPGHGIRQIFLEGSSGRNLAFGPTLLLAGSRNPRGDVVLSGHRDTHFRFLQLLGIGDLLRLTTPAGKMEFQVAFTEIIDSRTQQMTLDPGISRLTLVTCYPFDAATAGGPLRYVVTALPIK